MPNPSFVQEALKRRAPSLVPSSSIVEHPLSYQHASRDILAVAELKSCANRKDLDHGRSLHAHHIKNGSLEENIFIASTFVHMYAQCGALANAEQVFLDLPTRDVIAWTTLITAFTQDGHAEKALILFEWMQCDGIFPNANTFACILKACSSIGAAEKGKQIHVEIVRRGMAENDIVLGNALVDMYAKCGALSIAHEVFDQLVGRTVVSWTVLMAGYCQHGHGEEALYYFEQMQDEGLFPDAVTLLFALQACGDIQSIAMGSEIHAEIVGKGWMERKHVLGDALVDMYAKCGAVAKAQEVFDELLDHNVVSWTVLIGGYSEHGPFEKAMECFEQMQHEGLCPNAQTFSCILKACASSGTLEKGKQIHIEIVKGGFLEKDAVLSTALVDMYAKCGAILNAQHVFDELCARDKVSWTALITGYSQHGHDKQAIACFDQMKNEGFFPDAMMYALILNASANIGAAEKGKEVHAEMVREGLPGQDTFLGNALVDMYAKCGALAKAHAVFDELLVRDVVSWNALIAGYCQLGYDGEALHWYREMRHEGPSPNALTFACILKACGSIGAAEEGQEVHGEIVRGGTLAKDEVLATALVDMYAKCGALEKAEEVFDNLSYQDIVTWTALIAGYSQVGKHELVLESYNRMIAEDGKPNVVTFSVVLDAYNHLGLVDESQMFFESMSSSFGVIPTMAHYTCMVDLLGHAGHLDKATALVEKVQPFDYVPVWHALLNACQKWGNAELGNLAFEHVQEACVFARDI